MESVIVALVVSGIWCAASPHTRMATWLVDDPVRSDLTVHDHRVPALGGIGVVAAVVVSSISFDPWLLASLIAAVALGTVDDRMSLSPRVRLIAEIGLATALAMSPDVANGPLARFSMVLATVVMINAVNLLDGIDGLAGSTALISFLGLALLGERSLAPIAAAACAGFVVFNWPKAKLFLGDGGAYAIGVGLAYSAFVRAPDLASSFVGLALTGLFLVDLAVTVTRRALIRRPLFQGDRSHIYDQMAFARGLGPVRTLIFLILGHTAYVALVVLASLWLDPVALCFLALLLGSGWVAVLVRRGYLAPARTAG